MVFETDMTCNLQYLLMFCIDLRRVISFSVKGHEQCIQTKLLYIAWHFNNFINIVCLYIL